MNEKTYNRLYREITKNFQANVNHLREERYLTLRDLASLTGYSHSYVVDLLSREPGHREPSLDAIVRFATALRTNPLRLLEKNSSAKTK